MNILVVDDDRSVCQAIRICLEMEGFEVVVAGNGNEGIEALRRSRFDLLLLDLFMPGMDGFETIDAFRRRAPETPIIAMSGHMFLSGSARTPEFLDMSTKINSDYNLAKPFKPKDLLQAVRTCLGLAETRTAG